MRVACETSTKTIIAVNADATTATNDMEVTMIAMGRTTRIEFVAWGGAGHGKNVVRATRRLQVKARAWSGSWSFAGS